MKVCAEPGCPELVERGPRCPSHQVERGSTSERGYGTQHQRDRRRLLPAAYGELCPFCDEVMVEGQELDFDHSTPVAHGGVRADRFAHADCNRRAGATVRR